MNNQKAGMTSPSLIASLNHPTLEGRKEGVTRLARVFRSFIECQVRSHVRDPQKVADHTQQFLFELLSQPWPVFDSKRGNLRSLLAVRIRSASIGLLRKEFADKRGRFASHDPTDTVELVDPRPNPEEHLGWKHGAQVLDHCTRMLEFDYYADGRGKRFKLLKSSLESPGESNELLAKSFGKSANAVGQYKSVLRSQYCALVTKELTRLGEEEHEIKAALCVLRRMWR